MWNWEQFKSLPRVQGLSAAEKARQYFLHQSNMMMENNFNAAAAASSAAAGAGAGAGGTTLSKRKQVFAKTTNSEIILVKEVGAEYYTMFALDWDNNTINGPINTKVSVEYTEEYEYVIESGDSLFTFSNGHDRILLFVESGGTIIDTISFNSSNYDASQSRGVLLYAQDNQNKKFWMYDGTTLYEDSTTVAGSDYFSLGSDSSVDGSPYGGLGVFVVRGTMLEYYLFKDGESTLIDTRDYKNVDLVGGSAYFNGTSNMSVDVSNNSIFHADNNFTFEWFQFLEGADVSTNPTAFDYAANAGGGQLMVFFSDNGSNGRINIVIKSGDPYTFDLIDSVYQWSHFSINRYYDSGSDTHIWYVYQNGVRIGDFELGATYDTLSYLLIGDANYTTPGNHGFTGYITNFRINNGAALYTDTYVNYPDRPISPVESDGNTILVLLMHNQASLLIDSSDNNETVTNGGATWSNETPFVINSDYYLNVYNDKVIILSYIGSEYLSMDIYGPTGTNLHSIDLTGTVYSGLDHYSYGTGKELLFFYNQFVETDSLFYQYDGVLDTLQSTTHNTWNVTTDVYTDSTYPSNLYNYKLSENAAIVVSTLGSGFSQFEFIEEMDIITFFEGCSYSLISLGSSNYYTTSLYGGAQFVSTPYSYVFPVDMNDATSGRTFSLAVVTSTGITYSVAAGGGGYDTHNNYYRLYSVGEGVLLETINSESGGFLSVLNATCSSSNSIEWTGERAYWYYNNQNLRYNYDTIQLQQDGTSWMYNNTNGWDHEDVVYTSVRNPNIYFSASMSKPGVIVSEKEKERIYWFNDIPDDPNSISDGGDDMYDGGNYLHTNLYNAIPYTHTQMTQSDNFDTNTEATLDKFIKDGVVSDGNDYFGSGSNYFTNLYPGLFVLSVDSPSISNFWITGGLGSDGQNTDGDYNQSSMGYGGTTYSYFWKREWIDPTIDGYPGEPSVNHLIIVDSDGSGIVHDAAGYNDDDDYDTIYVNDGNLPITKLHFLVFSKWQRAKVTDSELANMVSLYLSVVHGKTISQTLTALNTNYGIALSPLPTHDTGEDIRVLTRNSITRFDINNPVDTIAVGDDRILTFFYDGNRDGEITVSLHDFAGNLIQKVETNEQYYFDYDVVGKEASITTYNYLYDGNNWYYDTHVYKLGAGSVSFNMPDEYTFVRQFNDFTWWYDA